MNEGWKPPPYKGDFAPVPELLEDEFMEIEADLGSGKVVLREGDVIRLKMNWMNFGGIKFRPEEPIWLKIKLVSQK